MNDVFILDASRVDQIGESVGEFLTLFKAEKSLMLKVKLFEALQIPTADYMVLHRQECADPSFDPYRLIERLGLPLILKSPQQGSSIGVVLVEKIEKLTEAIEEVFRYGDQVLAEEYLHGLELTLPILGNDEIIVLPEVELVSDAMYRSYEVKHTSGSSKHVIPARIPETTRTRIHEIGKNYTGSLAAVDVPESTSSWTAGRVRLYLKSIHCLP